MNRNSRCFTTRYPGITNVLINDVSVSEAFDPAQGGVHPQFRGYKAIWDTGASASVITEKVIMELGLAASGQTDVHTANGLVRNVNTYLVNIGLPNNLEVIGLGVTKGIITTDVDLLLGMDIIGMGDFAITNHEGFTCMSFVVPSSTRIDFVEEFNRRYGMRPEQKTNFREIENAKHRGRHKKR
ncbi:MAG: retroviral-like aspartic protease family protein [Ignavibacteriae bacterium]|nr:retroviral-like aspartic protease family protein [Ignavibacteria bacterium]MBI3364423.1 retroviral-like aspartic protease family protein [Ignavibacteriota bacterium]